MTQTGTQGTVHIVGAGLAGLSAAVRLAGAGRRVVLYEAADQAGGRCRSFYDNKLAREIDNGNHLLFSANREALSYLKTIGADGSLIAPTAAAFPFLDLRDGRRWTLRPGTPYWPFWLLDPSRRIPGVPLTSYLKLFRLARAKAGDRVADCLDPKDPLWATFWHPLTVAALNTQPDAAAARLLWQVLRESFLKGESACRPMVARHGLATSLVTPALGFLESRRAQLHLNRRLRAIERGDGLVRSLDFGAVQVRLGRADRVICAVPPVVAKGLLPEISAPQESTAIVNAHIRLDGQADALRAAADQLDPDLPFLGLIGGTVDWIFLRGDVVSLTVSAADALAARPNEEIVQRLWADTAKALGLAETPLPPLRLIKEKRATFAQTPAALAQRPGPCTGWRNLVLAGDWTDTGLPATIESAVTSGRRAAENLSGDLSQTQHF